MIRGIEAFGKTARGLSRNPLGIIALFIVLVYGIAALVTAFGTQLTVAERLPLIWFLVLFPILVLGVFAWLVSRHHTKLYSPSDYRNESHYLDMHTLHAASPVDTLGALRRGERSVSRSHRRLDPDDTDPTLSDEGVSRSPTG